MPESYMFFPADLSCSRKNCVRLLLFSLLLNSLVLTAFRAHAANNDGEAVRIKAKTARPEPQAGVQTFVRVINQPTNDIVSNPQMGVLHASVPSSFGPTGNSIITVDPVAASVGQPVFIGSEPNKLALSSDGKVLYAGLDGASAVRRFDVTTNTAGVQCNLGADQNSGSYLIGDLAVAPNTSNVV